jgi:hypothetical protein
MVEDGSKGDESYLRRRNRKTTLHGKHRVDAKINTLKSEGKYSPNSEKSTKRANQFDL